MDKLSIVIGQLCIGGFLLCVFSLLALALYKFASRNDYNGSGQSTPDLSPQDEKIVNEAVSILQADGENVNYPAVAKLFSAEACPRAVDLVAYMRQHVQENLDNSASNWGKTEFHQTQDVPITVNTKVTGKLAEQISRAEAGIDARRDANGRYIPPPIRVDLSKTNHNQNSWEKVGKK